MKSLTISPYVYAGIKITDLPLNVRKVIRTKTRRYTKELILDAIEKVTGISPRMLLDKTRKRPIVYARHIFCYHMRDKTTLSLTEIGTELGRDHTTVINSVRVYGDLYETDDAFFELSNRIEDELDLSSYDIDSK